MHLPLPPRQLASTRHLFARKLYGPALVALGLATLSGCASVDFDQSLAQTNTEAASFTQRQLSFVTTQAQNDARAATAADLLQRPLSQADAVLLALVNSPALQALLAQSWADAASATQGGRISNPLLSIGRMRMGSELELESALSFGLLDLLTLPQRQKIAQREIAQTQLRLTSDVIDVVTQVRQAWVRAVATQQRVQYATQVQLSAQASAELAQRMLKAGNFNKITQAHQQAYYVDSVVRLATAQLVGTAAREALVRLLGLSDEQAAKLQLPERLPDLPVNAKEAPEVSTTARAQRLDVRLASAILDTYAQSQGMRVVNSYANIELTAKQKTKSEDDTGSSVSGSGREVDVRLPLFDWGDAKRQGMNAQTLAAAQRLEATVRVAGSHLRESYATYRTAHDIARHYRDEVLPLRQAIADENMLRYNGMLIGVFELMADAREQVGTVLEALDAEQQFWLAEAALHASLLGKPTPLSMGTVTGGNTSSNASSPAH
jgi:outer membrane protein TolC